jgi:hypothetical protein
LFFPKITVLPDNHEGYLNEATLKWMKDLIDTLSGVERERGEENYKNNLQVFKAIRERIGICSWHRNDTESVSMWKVFLNQSDGIAIKSTYNKLKSSFSETTENIHIGTVKYNEDSCDIIRFDGPIDLIVQKRKIYEYENELRAIVIPRLPFSDPGIYININLDILIDEIVLSPGTQPWLFDLTKGILERYHLSKPLNYSIVDRLPSY